MTITAYRNSADERTLMNAIIEAATRRGYRVFHDEDSRKNPAGFPDLVLAKRGNLFFFETKTATGRIRPAQLDWLEELQNGQVLSARIVLPADLDDVLEELREAS